jgi:hypothetical protein
MAVSSSILSMFQIFSSSPQPLIQPHARAPRGILSMAPRIHSSTVTHTSTELAVLQQLRARSRAQHRSQIFLQRVDQVIRLTRIFLRELDDPSALSQKVIAKVVVSELTDAEIVATGCAVESRQGNFEYDRSSTFPAAPDSPDRFVQPAICHHIRVYR